MTSSPKTASAPDSFFTAGLAEADPEKEWTVRDVAKYAGIGGAGPVLVGSTEQIADQLEEWVDHGIDGFNIAYYQGARKKRAYNNQNSGVLTSASTASSVPGGPANTYGYGPVYYALSFEIIFKRKSNQAIYENLKKAV